MDDKNKRRGFSGLGDLTSDVVGKTPDHSRPTRANAAAPMKKAFALLKLTEWPTLPAPWSSVDAGETWIWGDFFFTFQKQPVTVTDLATMMQGKQRQPGGMTYHYAMTVFYRLDKNPHGPSRQPIMVIALEQLDMGKFMESLGPGTGEFMGSFAGPNSSPPMIGLFTGEGRFNLGPYEGEGTAKIVREHFFEHLAVHLGLRGSPKEIGELADAYGHPETGLPTNSKTVVRAKSGSRAVPGNDASQSRKAVEGGQKQGSSVGSNVLPWLCAAVVLTVIFSLMSTFSGGSNSGSSRSAASNSRSSPSRIASQPLQPTKVPAVTKYVSIDALNVRGGPGTSYEPIGRLQKYDTVTVLSSDSSGWGRVQIPNGKTGYVAVKYLGLGSGASAREEWCRQNAGQRPRNGELLKLAYRGPHSLTVRNAPGDDAVVKLKDRNDRTVMAMYVGSGQTATTESVPEGSFRIVYASGTEYSRACGYFLEDLEVSKAETSASFRTTKDAVYTYTAANELTLYKVNDGNLYTKQASLNEFLD